MHGAVVKIINSAASIGSHETHMKYVSFPWPAVVATHYHKRLAQHQKLLAPEQLPLCPGFSYIHCILPFPSNYAEDFPSKMYLV
jgi:hypothetical protein